MLLKRFPYYYVMAKSSVFTTHQVASINSHQLARAEGKTNLKNLLKQKWWSFGVVISSCQPALNCCFVACSIGGKSSVQNTKIFPSRSFSRPNFRCFLSELMRAVDSRCMFWRQWFWVKYFYVLSSPIFTNLNWIEDLLT